MRAIRTLLHRALPGVVLMLLATRLAAQGPAITLMYQNGDVVPNWTSFRDSDQQSFVVRVCSPGSLTSLTGSITNANGSSSLSLGDGASVTCPDGGSGYFAELSLAPDLNTITISATNSYSNSTSTSFFVTYVPPFRARVVAPGDGGLRVPPSTTVVLPFTVTNSGTSATTFGVTVSCSGALSLCKRVAGNLTSFTTGTLSPGASEVHDITVTGGAMAGSGTLSLVAVPTGQSAYSGTGSTPIAVTAAPPPAPVVSRGRDSVAVAPSTSRTAHFTLRNPDEFASRTITMTGTCGTLTNCAVSPSTVTLGPTRDTLVTVSFSVPSSPSTQTTKVLLRATASSPADSSKDSSTVVVGTVPSAVVTVSVADQNPGTSISRDQCLSVAAGAAAGVECGALRVAHGIPGVRTMGVDRAPTLLYLSDHGYPFTRVAARVSVRNLTTTPDSLRATLTVSSAGVTKNIAWPWAAECATAAGCRVTIPLTTWAYGSLPTGAYDYTLEIRVGSGSPPTGTATGSFAVVDNRASAFGQGWWLEGHERLVAIGDTTKMLWIGGDGSTRVFVKQSATVWTVVAQVARPERLERSGGFWYRRLRNGGSVKFDALLRHIATRNRQGDSTRFVYNATYATQLDSIVLPRPSGGAPIRAFTIAYSGTPRLARKIIGPSQVTGGAARIDSLEYDADSHLTRIIDPDLTSVRFLYYAYSTTGLLVGRVNRLSDTTLYTFDGWAGVAQVTVKMRTAPAIVSTVCAAESRSLATCSGDGGAYRPVPIARAVTRLDGPRSDVSDVTRFHVGRFGAPDTLVDALGARVRLRRDTTSFPALVTQVTDGAGLVTRTAYNSRGLPTTTRVMAPYGAADSAMTTYTWHSTWDMTTQTQSPTGEVDYVGIDSATGNRLWQRRGAHDSTKVSFAYDTNGRLTTVTSTAAGTVATLTYESTLGNLWKSTSALGFVTEMKQNAIGADTSVWTPTDSAQTSGLRVRERVVHDVMGRVLRSETIAPAVPWSLNPVATDTGTAAARTAVVKTEYDSEGRSLSVVRFSMPDSSSGATAKTWVVYDAAGRVTGKHEWHTSGVDTLTYDPAGNVVSTTSRRNLTVRTAYDALNRVITRTTPAVTYARTWCSECKNIPALNFPGEWPWQNDTVYVPDHGTRIAPYVSSPDLIIPAEVTVFGYDAAGRMVQADNPDVRIRRGYFPNGALRADTTWIRNYDIGATTPFEATRRSVLTYAYDLSGRRTSRTDHRSGTQRYAYDALGQLASTTDRAVSGGDSVVVTFSFDALGRLRTQSVPSASVTAAWTYDIEGRPTIRAEEGFSDTIQYDPRGKRISVRGRTVMLDAGQAGMRLAYDALGQVVASANDDAERPLVTDEIRMDAQGNQLVRHANRNSITSNTESRDSSTYIGHRLVRRVGEFMPDGRVMPGIFAPAIPVTDSLGIEYDNSGNVVYQILIRRAGMLDEYPLPGGGSDTALITGRALTGHSWTYNFFDATERLRYAQRTTMPVNAENRTILDEYWYDALGRRVVVRTRVDSLEHCWETETFDTPVHCQQQYLRTTWDGDQILFEDRMVGGWQQADGNVGESTPVSEWYGTIRYTQTGAIDAPVLLWRKAGSENFRARVLHRNWRGNIAGATFGPGAGAGTADASTVWPAAVTDVWLAPDSRQSPPAANKWLGSLVTDGKDATGTLYRRNRYYDPVSGRFTQEDPIGVAGGLNLYGYAAGDPVNGSDPFGLTVEIRPEDMQTRRLYLELKDAVRAALRSEDADRRGGAMLLQGMISRMERTQDHTFRLQVGTFSQGGGGIETCSLARSGPCDVLVSTSGISGPLTTMAHEMGGALVSRFVGPAAHAGLFFGANHFENAARRMFGCGNLRAYHFPDPRTTAPSMCR